jgi:hypothetical protein
MYQPFTAVLRRSKLAMDCPRGGDQDHRNWVVPLAALTLLASIIALSGVARFDRTTGRPPMIEALPLAMPLDWTPRSR